MQRSLVFRWFLDFDISGFEAAGNFDDTAFAAVSGSGLGDTKLPGHICSYQFNVHINHLSILLKNVEKGMSMSSPLGTLRFLWRNSKIRIIIGVLVPEAFHQLQFRGLPRGESGVEFRVYLRNLQVLRIKLQWRVHFLHSFSQGGATLHLKTCG